MTNKTKTTAVIIALVATAVVFFFAVLVICVILPNDDMYAKVEEDFGMKFVSMEVDAKWRKDRSCRIEQNIVAEFYMPSHGIYVDIPVNSGEKVRDLKVTATDGRGMSKPYSFKHEEMFKIVRIVVGDPDVTMGRGERLICRVEYDYIVPVHPDGKNILDINAIGYGWTSKIENASVSVTYPSVPDNGENFGVWIDGEKTDGITVSADGKTYSVKNVALDAFQGIRFKYEMPGGVLTDRSDHEWVQTVFAGIVIAVALTVLMIFVGKEKTVTPIVSFYPPYITGKDGRKRRMLPIQMGKIIDGACSDNDVTSLIFYWASEGYLSIEEKDDEIYFTKLKEIDSVTEYERVMFDALFKKAKPKKSAKKKKETKVKDIDVFDEFPDDGKSFVAADEVNGDDSGLLTVALSSLKGEFAGAVLSAKNGVNIEYRGKLFKGWYTLLAVMATVLCAVYGICNAVLITLRIGSGFINTMGFIVSFPILLSTAMGYILSRHYMKFSVVKRRVMLGVYVIATILLSFAVILFLPTDAMSWAEKFVFAACLGLSTAVSPFLTKRTEFYDEQLNEIIGFRDFLRDAEKDRLETLLNDDPQYYYNILPYANVLGVSKIWSDKFNDLSFAPPSYYRGRDVSVFDIYFAARLTSSIGSSLTYRPPKASGGSFSGGHGGGGGSFGGFGGGGGGRW